MTSEAGEPEALDNLEIWTALGKTDPEHTKPFKRSGGFAGTAINPLWAFRRLTSMFGPCGIGWGMERPDFQVVPGDNREVLVYCTVAGWYVNDGRRAELFGVGGDKAVTYIKANAQHKRPERWENDDEAFKKAYTDAIGNAFKFIGIGADVRMGLFEDSKYIAEIQREFEAEKVLGITKIKTRLRAMQVAGDDPAITLEGFRELKRANKADLKAIRDANHLWWTGDGGDVEGFGAWIARRERELAPPDDDGMVKGMIESMKQCNTKRLLESWMIANGDAVEALDGAEGRTFELALALHESGIEAMDTATGGA